MSRRTRLTTPALAGLVLGLLAAGCGTAVPAPVDGFDTGQSEVVEQSTSSSPESPDEGATSELEPTAPVETDPTAPVETDGACLPGSRVGCPEQGQTAGPGDGECLPGSRLGCPQEGETPRRGSDGACLPGSRVGCRDE